MGSLVKAPPPLGRVDFALLQGALVDLAARVEGVDMRVFEAHPPEPTATELPTRVVERLDDAQRIAADIERLCANASSTRLEGAVEDDVFPTAFTPFERTLDAALAPHVGWSMEAVGDVAFLARLELRQRAERVAHLARGHNLQALICECDSSLRRIRKALTSIDQGLERAGLVPARLDFSTELETSLAARRTYAALRGRIRAIGPPSAEDLSTQLRAVGTAIATVVGWAGYRSLRLGDRIQMRELQRRLLDWFHGARDVTEGERLWLDIDAFVQLLVDVNRRQELREHDALAVAALWETFERTDGAIPPPVMRRLESLEGLDEELDALLAGAHGARIEAWRAPLARLFREHHRSGSAF